MKILCLKFFIVMLITLCCFRCNHNTFADDAAKLGIPREATLTRGEWRAVRRHMQKRARRFSRAFIVSQLSERNKFRSTFRCIQNNPHVSNKAGFGFDVYAPIRAGSMVTAYNKRFRVVQRGRVLTHDRLKSLYLVEFENKRFGYELCPDSDVALSGRPEVLIAVVNGTLIRGRKAEDLGSLMGSRAGPSENSRSFDNFDPTKDIDVKKLMRYSRIDSTVRSSKTASKHDESAKKATLFDTIANQEAFLTLLEVIDIARNRKGDLLTSIEDANALLVNNLPMGEIDGAPKRVLSHETQEHLRWLLFNLERTDYILGSALKQLRLLYGSAYGPYV
jgi:DIRP